MNVTGVRIEIIKRVSDGDYGFEQFNAQYIGELEPGEDPDAAIRELAKRGRAEVTLSLGESGSIGVRHRIEAPKVIDHDDPMHEDDLASDPCIGCGKRWILNMDDSGLCPRCGTFNASTNPDTAVRWSETEEGRDDIPF